MDVFQFLPDQINQLPEKPGIYRFYSDKNILLYVGKAKNLKKRVSSYFQSRNNLSGKTKKLVIETRKIEITLVNSEMDAFLLENSLIKKHQPKYNILLKDDKTFPFICVTHEPFPRVFYTRRVHKGSGQYFGPYANVRAMKNVLELIRNLYHIRTCHYPLTAENIKKKKYKICLEYHIGKCKGPCEGRQEETDYQNEIHQVIAMLKGELKPARDYFIDRMKFYSSQLEFEKAETAKQRLQLLDQFQAKTVVVNPKITNIDVFSISSDDKAGYINYMKVNNGSIIYSQTIEVRKKLNEPDDEILAMWMVEFRNKYQSQAQEVLSNIPVKSELNVKIDVPKIGDKRRLVELSLKNVLYFKKEKITIRENTPARENRILSSLQTDLKLKNLPYHIECFDNSNVQGSHPVASMVCFKNGLPSKRDYRKFNIKTVTGPDDFASMKEIVTRRYNRQKSENSELPDLIIIDGGKGQLHMAAEALQALGLYGQIPIIGIAKKLEEIYFPHDSVPLFLDKRSASLKLLQRIRNEAHRFAITYHRQKREKNMTESLLDSIPGIGEKTRELLLKKFKSIKNIQQASQDEIALITGKKKARILEEYIKRRG